MLGRAPSWSAKMMGKGLQTVVRAHAVICFNTLLSRYGFPEKCIGHCRFGYAEAIDLDICKWIDFLSIAVSAQFVVNKLEPTFSCAIRFNSPMTV